MIKYVIINESERGFWSNQNGWGDFIDATRFDEVDIEICFLPADSEWMTEEEAKSHEWITEEDED